MSRTTYAADFLVSQAREAWLRSLEDGIQPAIDTAWQIARETGISFLLVLSAMWELVSEGALEYDANAMVFRIEK